MVAAEPAIRIAGLYKIFGANPAAMLPYVQAGMGKTELLEQHGHVLGLRDINLNIPAQGIQVVMGLSGSGKSTLIRHINRLIEPTAGQVIVAGQDVLAMSPTQLRAFRRKHASMVFQRFALLPHRTVAQNIAYGLRIQGIDAATIASHADRWISRVGLDGFADHYPAQLSGGMQQRVGLARALATDAEILLMDEAFSALDPMIRTDMQRILLDLQSELRRTIVFITHDLDEALLIGDRVAILRDGAVIQDAAPEDIILHPADGYIADFTKDINRARVIEVGSIMVPAVASASAGAPSLDAPRLDAHTKLEDAARALVNGDSTGALVTNGTGAVVGSVTTRAIVAAMVRPDDARDTDAEAVEPRR